MGACVMQRDEDMDQLPKIQAISEYSKNKIEEIEKELKEIKEMSDETATKKAQEEYNKTVASIERKHKKKNVILEINTHRCFSKVKAWQPPTSEHVGLKAFMENQIKESINFDCGTSYYIEELKNTRLQSATEYKAKQLEYALKDLDYHKKQLTKEIERTESRNNWITKLYESLEEKK
jgi:hypothetical protein